MDLLNRKHKALQLDAQVHLKPMYLELKFKVYFKGYVYSTNEKVLEKEGWKSIALVHSSPSTPSSGNLDLKTVLNENRRVGLKLHIK